MRGDSQAVALEAGVGREVEADQSQRQIATIKGRDSTLPVTKCSHVILKPMVGEAENISGLAGQSCWYRDKT